uniref:SGNH hydrolase-type esterase domain-containing protein n=1 Tax=Leersia perrieri TaxID=77586 RepID=A0A0D9WQG8_9ORYZ
MCLCKCHATAQGCSLFVLLLLLAAVIPPASCRANPARNISAIFIFGDSTVDPGNNNNRLTLSKANFPPYGQDFPGGLATGRFSNGKAMGDMIASRLGVKELIPPYLGDGLQLDDLLTGVAFASGGSGYDPLTSKITKEKLRTLVGEETMTQVVSEALYFTSMGGNDLVNNYFLIPFKQDQYNLSSYVDFLISSAVNFTLQLNQMGAKRIGYFGIPPVGCSPSQIILGGHPSKECDQIRNQASELFNSKMKMEIDRLNAEQNIYGLNLAYIDFYSYLLQLTQQPEFYGFKEAAEGCCGSTLFDASIFIAYHTPCSNVLDYIYWDGFHPTEKAYRTVVDNVLRVTEEHLM